MTKFDETSIVKLADLDYDGVHELAIWCNEALAYDSPRCQARLAKDNQESEKRAAQSEKLKKKREDLVPKIKKYLLENDNRIMLKIAGCRDGEGVREFLHFDENEGLVCRKFTFHRGEFRPEPYITTHSISKVRKAWNSTREEWIPIEEIVKNRS